MDNLYFTLASLPHLEPGAPAPFTDLDAFWLYVDHIPEHWRGEFESATAQDPTVREFREWDLALRTALARIRLEGLPWQDEQVLPSGGHEWVTQAAALLRLETPLQVEIALDALRWERVDELSQGHQFDRVAFFAYALKLQLVLRRSRLVLEPGLEVFDALHAAVVAQTDLNIPMGDKS